MMTTMMAMEMMTTKVMNPIIPNGKNINHLSKLRKILNYQRKYRKKLRTEKNSLNNQCYRIYRKS